MAQAELIWTPGAIVRLGSGAAALSESFADASGGTGARRMSPAGPDEPGPVEVPSGTVTFLLTDIEGSTRLWETAPDAMKVALEQHDRVAQDFAGRRHGQLIDHADPAQQFQRQDNGGDQTQAHPCGAVHCPVSTVIARGEATASRGKVRDRDRDCFVAAFLATIKGTGDEWI